MMVALANSKGGVGKSTLAVHIAVWLQDHGVRVALLDADKQQSSSLWLKDVDPGVTVRVATTPEECLDAAVELAESHDIVIGDGPAGLDEISRTLLLVANLALIPVGPSILDVRSVQDAIQVFRYAQRISPKHLEGALVLNKVGKRDRISRELICSLPQLGLGAAVSTIRNLTAFRDAAQQGTVVGRLGKTGRSAADDLDKFCVELFASIPGNPVDLQTPGGVLDE
ncbi:MAG: ParA family protein [Phycisphaera sp. RhM]|nr:ParA family protein [Phycisphaera sp. RhM]